MIVENLKFTLGQLIARGAFFGQLEDGDLPKTMSKVREIDRSSPRERRTSAVIEAIRDGSIAVPRFSDEGNPWRYVDQLQREQNQAEDLLRGFDLGRQTWERKLNAG